MNRAKRRREKCSHLSIYHVYSKNMSKMAYVFSASGRSYLAFIDNTMHHLVLSCHFLDLST